MTVPQVQLLQARHQENFLLKGKRLLEEGSSSHCFDPIKNMNMKMFSKTLWSPGHF